MLYNHELMSLINKVLLFFSRTESIFWSLAFVTQNKLDSFFYILPGLQVYAVDTSNIFGEI